MEERNSMDMCEYTSVWTDEQSYVLVEFFSS